MSKLQRVGRLDLPLQRPLEFDVYDPDGRLLLRRGQELTTPEILEELIRRGASRLALVSEDPNKHMFRKNPNWHPFETLDQMALVLQDVLLLSPDPLRLRGSILSLAEGVQETCFRDEDVALATIHLAERKAHSIRHQLDVAILTEILCKKLGHSVEERKSAICAALTMNLSVLELQERLNQSSSGLTLDEREVLRCHPDCTAEILTHCGIKDPLWLETIQNHHESYDGSGYPRGLSGDAVPIPAQVVHLADVYGARVTQRKWAQQEKSNQTLLDLLKGLGKVVRADIGALLVRTLGIFPPGNHVLLENGEIGIVLKRGKDANTPIVCAYVGPSGLPLGCPLRRDTSIEQFRCVTVVDAPAVDVKLSPKNLWGEREMMSSNLSSSSSSHGP